MVLVESALPFTNLLRLVFLIDSKLLLLAIVIFFAGRGEATIEFAVEGIRDTIEVKKRSCSSYTV